MTDRERVTKIIGNARSQALGEVIMDYIASTPNHGLLPALPES